MIYRVFKTNPKNGKVIKDNDYDSIEKAEKRVGDLSKGTGRAKRKNKTAYIGEIPENIGYGYKIYRPNGDLYGTIAHIPSRYFWYVIPAWKAVDDPLDYPFFLKQNFEQKFVDGIFKPIDGDPNEVIVPSEEELRKLSGIAAIEIDEGDSNED